MGKSGGATRFTVGGEEGAEMSGQGGQGGSGGSGLGRRASSASFRVRRLSAKVLRKSSASDKPLLATHSEKLLRSPNQRSPGGVWEVGGSSGRPSGLHRRAGSDEAIREEAERSPGGTLREAASSPGIAALDGGPMAESPSKLSSRTSLVGTDSSSSKDPASLQSSTAAARISNAAGAIKNFLAPTYKTRSEEFRRLFPGLPESERLCVDYSCAFQREILVHGRIYLTQASACFYANIFKWETTFVLPFKSIGAITKERTAKVIPNAIQVITNQGDKYFFTSFASRDKSYMAFFKLWQAALLDQPMAPDELWAKVQCSYEGTNLDDDDDDEHAPSLSVSGGGGGLESGPDAEFPSKGEKASPPLGDNLSEASDEGEKACPCTSHQGTELLNRVYPLSVDQVFLLLFTDSPFFRDFQDYRNAEDNRLEEWRSEGGKKVREVRFALSLNHSMGPKSTEVFEKQTYEDGRSGVYTVRCEASNTGIPYADSFVVLTTYCLTRVSENSSRIRAHGCPLFKKNIWGIVKSFIEKNTTVGISEHFADLDTCLRRECSRLGLPSGGKEEGESPSERPKGPKKGERAHHLTGAQEKALDADDAAASSTSASLSSLGSPGTMGKVFGAALLLLLLLNALLYWRLLAGGLGGGSGDPESRWEALLTSTLTSLADMEAELASLKAQLSSAREALQASRAAQALSSSAQEL